MADARLISPAVKRKILALHDGGVSYAEIGRRVGRSKQAIKSRVRHWRGEGSRPSSALVSTPCSTETAIAIRDAERGSRKLLLAILKVYDALNYERLTA